MQFGYFTLSDNNYVGLNRSPEQLMLEIREQCIHADKIGMHSAWVGEHHFDTLGVNSCPHMLLASIVPLTKNIRFAPAVAVLPLHHPLRVAEEWATLDVLSGGRVDFAVGRGYDRREYEPFGADYMHSLELLDEGCQIIQKAWTEPARWSFKGAHFDIADMAITPKPIQRPVPFYMACFSRASMEIAARQKLNILFAPFAAAMNFGDLAGAVNAYREECAKVGTKPGRAMCSYFIHIAETPIEEEEGREAMMRYFKYSVLPAFKQTPGKTPPTMLYFNKIVDVLERMQKDNLSDKSILLGKPEQIIETLERVEAAGIEEVILYFSAGGKPHELVMKQMSKFMETIAPSFARRKKEKMT